jgi:hypothetical protein
MKYARLQAFWINHATFDRYPGYEKVEDHLDIEVIHFSRKKGFSALSSSDCFLSLLMTAKNYCSTDPRDKIFAILGLLEALDVPPPLEPDYEIPVCWLYTCR